jgi:nuclear receptor subfamily 4 group A protein 2
VYGLLFLCLNSILERHGLAEPKKVELLENRILGALRDHVTYNPEAQRKPQYLSRILGKWTNFVDFLQGV